MQGKDPSEALTGKRKAYWPEGKAWIETPVYVFEQLQPGNVVEGPAICEAEFTTVVIPPGQRFSIDKHGLGILEAIHVAPSRRRVGAAKVTVSA